MRQSLLALGCCLAPLLSTPAWAALTDDHLIDHVQQAVIRNHLVTNPACVDYVIERKITPRVDEVDLLDHTGKNADGVECGGDPDIGVTLFSVVVDRLNGGMASNAADPGDPFPTGFKTLK